MECLNKASASSSGRNRRGDSVDFAEAHLCANSGRQSLRSWKNCRGDQVASKKKKRISARVDWHIENVLVSRSGPDTEGLFLRKGKSIPEWFFKNEKKESLTPAFLKSFPIRDGKIVRTHPIWAMFYLGQFYLGQFYSGQVYLGQVLLRPNFCFFRFRPFWGCVVVVLLLCCCCGCCCVVVLLLLSLLLCVFAQTLNPKPPKT